MAWKIELDISRCCACGACAIACMDQNDIDLSTGVRPYRTVFREETRRTGEIRYYSMACMHCDNARNRPDPLQHPVLHRLSQLCYGLSVRRAHLRPRRQDAQV